jgi:hypothetical protein
MRRKKAPSADWLVRSAAAASRKDCSARLVQHLVAPLIILPPVIFVPGHRLSRLEKCLSLGNRVMSALARQHNGLQALVELQNGDAAPSFAASTSNFYAVTRYNWSNYYAIALIELRKTVRTVYRSRP